MEPLLISRQRNLRDMAQAIGEYLPEIGQFVAEGIASKISSTLYLRKGIHRRSPFLYSYSEIYLIDDADLDENFDIVPPQGCVVYPLLWLEGCTFIVIFHKAGE